MEVRDLLPSPFVSLYNVINHYTGRKTSDEDQLKKDMKTLACTAAAITFCCLMQFSRRVRIYSPSINSFTVLVTRQTAQLGVAAHLLARGTAGAVRAGTHHKVGLVFQNIGKVLVGYAVSTRGFNDKIVPRLEEWAFSWVRVKPTEPGNPLPDTSKP